MCMMWSYCFPIDEKDCARLSMRCHCVLTTSMEFSLRPNHAYATAMVSPCHVVKALFVKFMIPIVLFKLLISLFI